MPTVNNRVTPDAESSRAAKYHDVVAKMDRVGVLVADGKGVITYASASARSMLGFSDDTIAGDNIRNYLNPDDVDAVVDLLERTLGGANVDGRAPIRMLSSSGTWRILEIVARRVEIEGLREVVFGMIDATERVNAQQRLREVEEQRSRAQRVARVSNWELNTTNGRMTGSKQFFRNFGLPAQSSIGFHELEEHIHPDDRRDVTDAIGRARTAFEDLDVTFRIIRSDERERVLHFLGETELVGKDLIMFGTAQDITKSHQLRRRLVESERRLRSLMGRLHSAQEDERKRLASEVHDVLGQAMTAVRMEISQVKSSIPEGNDELAARVDSAIGLIEETIQTVRRISHELRPAVLDHFGIAAALEWQSEQFQARSGLECSFRETNGEAAENLDVDLATALFRVFQEALTNVVRHAEASRIETSFVCKPDNEIVLTIRDDGKGLAHDNMGEDAETAKSSLGLLSMRERLLPWKGTVEFDGTTGSGTTVTVRVPVPSQTPALELKTS